MTVYRRRALGRLLNEALASLPVVVVTGLRQAGKTTFLQNEPGLAGRRFVTLDDFAQLAAARSDPEAFVRSEGPLTIDEAQRCPELLQAIKREVDRDRTPGRFVLSGSANFALLQGVSESLAGRAVYLTLHPFGRRELTDRLDSQPVLRRLFESGRPPHLGDVPHLAMGEVVLGGLPPACLPGEPGPALWFKGYEQTYLERDVRALARVGDIISFRNLLHLVALRTGQVLSTADLARDAKLSAATAGRHLGLLEASFVVFRLAPYLANRASRLIKAPKVYIGDSGLACHLTGCAGLRDGQAPLSGALLETYVANNLVAILDAEWPQARLGYWHVQGRHEVDFVVEEGTDCLAIEVKTSGRWDDRDLAGLRAFLARTPTCRVAVLGHGGDSTVQLGDRLWAMPLGSILA
ncbi:MAG: ATP-binding protein [Thermoanaerobaculaceae bacterium]|jgi:hypothetical protein|nr:ATP-binding protein [Thermoanaerobaculaceae bacterium]